MGGKDNVLFPLPGHVQDYVMALALIFPLIQQNLRRLRALFYKGNRRLGIDIHTGNLVSLMYEAAQLPLVNIKIRIIGVAIIGDEAHRAVFQQVLIEPVAHVAIHQNNLASALA